VHVAQNGALALEILATTPIDVLVTDLGMAGMDGIELMTMVADRFPKVTRIAHSADTSALEAESTRGCADFVLAKPASPERFAAVLDQALERRHVCAGH
jgi:CheY-like chemotaxis protein